MYDKRYTCKESRKLYPNSFFLPTYSHASRTFLFIVKVVIYRCLKGKKSLYLKLFCYLNIFLTDELQRDVYQRGVPRCDIPASLYFAGGAYMERIGRGR